MHDSYFESIGAIVDVTASGDFLVAEVSIGALSAATGGATFLEYAHAASDRRVVRTMDSVQWSWPDSVAQRTCSRSVRLAACYPEPAVW